MDDSAKSIEAIGIRNIQDAYVEEDVQYIDNKYPIQPTEDEADELEDYNDLTLSIRKKRDEITSISQTLNYVLVHATKPGSEPYSMIRRIMRTADGLEDYAGGHRAQQFSLLRTIMSPQWNADKHFTNMKQYYRWLEDINRYESENEAIADHVKIATIINHLKGPINQHLMLRVTNTTTFDEVHGWISNYFNSIYIGVDEEQTQAKKIATATSTNHNRNARTPVDSCHTAVGALFA
eukprot:1863565-Amphidinium_carterae.5